MTKERKDQLRESIQNLNKSKDKLNNLVSDISELCNIVNIEPVRPLTKKEIEDFMKLDQERVKMWRYINNLEYAIRSIAAYSEHKNLDKIIEYYLIDGNSRTATASRFNYSEERIKQLTNDALKLINEYIYDYPKTTRQ